MTSEVQTNQEAIHLELVQGTVGKALWIMFWPLFLNSLTMAAAFLIDSWFAGQLGSDQLAAVATGSQIWFAQLLPAMAISAGGHALASRHWGGQEKEKTLQTTITAIQLSFLTGIAFCLISILSTPHIVRFMTPDVTIAGLCHQYLHYFYVAMPLLTIIWVIHSIFRALGNSKTPTLIMFIITAMVGIFDAIFILSPLKIGCIGLGLSWLLASSIGLAISYFSLGSYLSTYRLTLKTNEIFNPKICWQTAKSMLSIGVPVSLAELSTIFANLVILKLLSMASLASQAQAAWSISFRFQDCLGGMPIYALGVAVATVVGQNLGAKKTERASHVAKLAIILGFGSMSIVSLTLFVFADQLALYLTPDPQVQVLCAQFFRIVGLFLPFNAIWTILFGTMEGAGFTLLPAVCSITMLLLIEPLTTYYLVIVKAMGATGAWWAMGLTSLWGAVSLGLLYLSGKWKN
jgi:putative MATE family efflux protein